MLLYILSLAAILTLFLFLAGLFYRIRYALRGESNNGQERRRDERMPIDVSAEILAAGCEPIHGHTHDLSVSGVFVLSDCSLNPGSECEVCLVIPGRNAPIRLQLRGRVARVTGDGLGVEFTAMNRECYENLSYIIKHNKTVAPDRSVSAD